MKEKILTLVIGALIGAIITTGVFLIINKNNAASNNQMQNGRRHIQQRGNFNTDNMPQSDMPAPPDLPNGETPDQGNQPSGNMQNSNSPSNMKNNS